MAFLGSIYKDFSMSNGATFKTLWPLIIDGLNYRDSIIGGTVAFDHFTRELSRPEPGPHYYLNAKWGGDLTLRSDTDADGNGSGNLQNGTNSPVKVIIPNGTTGYLRDVGLGGHPLENALSDNHGDFDSEYTINAGSYYEKVNAAILFAESEDRFISQSRQDFYDARFRAVGMADIFGEGFRRVIANALTDDRSTLASHITATNAITPELNTAGDPLDPSNQDAKMYPAKPIGWTSWWPNDSPTVCFPANGSNVCANYTKDWTGSDGGFKPIDPTAMMGVDPQIGWEVQKFLVAWTVAYITANDKANWIDMMRIYRLGQNNEPSLQNRIEWADPETGQIYYAHTYGKECLFGTVNNDLTTEKDRAASCVASGGKWVQKGIAARVLEYANELTAKGYKLDVVTYPQDPDSSLPAGFNAYGRAMVVYQPDGGAVIKADSAISAIDSSGGDVSVYTCDLNAPVDCDPNPPPPATNNCDAKTSQHPKGCTPLTTGDNHDAWHLSKYKSVPDFMWEVVIQYGMGEPGQLGVYP
jgi:hypothetical protein